MPMTAYLKVTHDLYFICFWGFFHKQISLDSTSISLINEYKEPLWREMLMQSLGMVWAISVKLDIRETRLTCQTSKLSGWLEKFHI